MLGAMNRGGVETWLISVLRHIDRRRFRMDFLAHTAQPGAYDEEIRSLGSKVIFCPAPRRPWLYARNFRRALAAHGPFDVVHSHVHSYSGYVLRLAAEAGVRHRIAHSHSDTSRQRARAGLLRRTYFALAGEGIRRYATRGLAASQPAARALFGPGWHADPRRTVLYYGCDLGPFRAPVNRAAVRIELGLKNEDVVIGHVGRFAEPKNHEFWVDTAARIAQLEPKARFLLVGDGPLRPMIKQKAARLGLAKRIVFAGCRADVARLMLGAIDVLLFPSLWEGLPLTVIEAQAAGLPIVASEAVPEEAVVVGPLVRRLRLAQGPEAWAAAAVNLASKERCVSQDEAAALVERSPFHVRKCVRQLEEIYQYG